MDIRIKYPNQWAGLCLWLCLLLLSPSANAQFRHKWQADISVGTALPAQDEYYIKDGYPIVSAIGNMRIGIRADAQLMRNLNNRVAAGGGVSFTSFSSLSIPNEKERNNFALSSSTLNLSGRIYPLGRNYRFTPFLQANASYGQISIAHSKYKYTVDSLSRHSGNPDHPVLLQITFSKPEASQRSNVLGVGAIAGAEFLLNDAVGLTWQAGYHLHKTEQMQLLQEDLLYWDFKLGLFIRIFKTKRFY